MTPDAYRSAQQSVLAELASYLLAVLRLAPAQPTAQQWADLIAAAYPAVYRARMDAWRVATDWYAAQRAIQIGESGPVDLPRRNYDPAALDKAWRRVLKPALDALGDGERLNADRQAQAVATAQRHAAAAGRDAVVDAARHDPEALGYARVATGASTCAFCLMLTSRGPVYRSADSALLRDGTGEPYHDWCDCIAAPVFVRDDWPGREDYLSAARAWRDHGGDLRSFRRWLTSRDTDQAAAAA